MKNNFYILCTFALLILVAGCKKSFLDETPEEELSAEQIKAAAEKDPSLLNGNIAGLYSTMYNDFTGGTENHDDFGQKGYDIYSDMLCSDMALGNLDYGWYGPIVRYTATKDFTVNEAYTPWRYYYRIIFGANTVIDALGGSDAEQTDAVTRHIMGQAKAMRAYAYFYLAQFYSTGYGSGADRILPIYTTTTIPNQPLSTSAQVYDLMIADLTQSIEYLNDFSRTSKDQIDKYVAEGLLSYVYAARGTNTDLAQVVTLTDDIITTGGFPLTSQSQVVAVLNDQGVLQNPASGFNNIATPSWMWGVDLTLASELDLVSWWGQVDLYTYSYAWVGDTKEIDAGLYASIPDDDIRKKQFDESLMPTGKFFDPARVIGGQRNVVTDYIYMRVDEFYLLNAEAHAKLGQDGDAKTRLKQLLAIRVPDDSYVDALSGTTLQKEIYLQTRIELWGEGKSYLALKRDKETLKRGSNHLFFAGQSFAYNSDELTFPIPQAEVINNPVLNK